ncbi:Alkaline shock response membrane anchor protein AmaP OS=Tsukamurella paurometabola (strain ATCC 8368/ DSM / CCUG 35730 / CIP 100753 / JCM 10117 / KCTC 9821 / NBRC 16120 / NCIMB 702349 / NCTC 13040) OX=521096 GN=Tpau_0286 PE=4 SV=1 [Tsukamurella paurometabola]|uniref:Alkaline shock response membrane anchor protein AmaP n=1 Tax=Tsukamurella paurometabola (strain ATCC 8368 / DSM 20162 / CCUG 35730 / CIP 100753 / JCM 10117 / KCTC 9821 / NBRC 16120 / NCIMB 702349 / NCTC 13040) TaxID=521096 RepID=D5UQV0_TSUPD|nr:alkaline shock response membrane anchor protein AmaP [Tsukamurella paurometabola]ADG76933.1 conserved hypothetical protein [Tsukamurella paurometabola DSM 20162]SUP42259.1 Uncharacterised protein [Tsukamurella paurometabola]
MRSSTRLVDRFITLLTGLVLLGIGGWLLAYRLGERHIVSASQRLIPDKIADTPDSPWWNPAVGIAGVALVLLALWLLLQHLRTNTAKTVATAHGGTVDLTKVATAVAEDLSTSPLIRKARSTTIQHKDQPTIQVRVTIAPGAPVQELAELARAAQTEVTAATNPDIGLQLLVDSEDK